MGIVELEYKRDNQLKREHVKSLMLWIESQQHFPKMTEHEAIWFLKSCYYSNEAAKTTIENYFTMKMSSPEFLRNRSLDLKSLQAATETITISVLPQKTPAGMTVLVSHLEDATPSRFNFNEVLKLLDMMCLLDLYKNGTHEGLRYCIDMEGVTFAHIIKVGLISLKKFCYYFQEAMPIRLKGLHFFNITPVMEKLMILMKPFLKKEVIDMINLHQTVTDMKNFIPLELLPSDYGGKYSSFAELNEQMRRNITENSDFFAYQDAQLVDESKRLGKLKSASKIFGVDGTFKKLEID